MNFSQLCRATLAAGALALAMTQAVQAAVVVTIDARNAAAVVVTGTGENSLASSTGTGYGVNFIGALQGNANFAALTPSNSTFASAAGGKYNYFATAQDPTVLLSNGGGTNVQTFVAGAPAFTGTATVNLSGLTFRTGTVTGDVRVRSNTGVDLGIVIGQYTLIGPAAPVPEPSTWALAGLGIGSLALWRARRRAAQPL